MSGVGKSSSYQLLDGDRVAMRVIETGKMPCDRGVTDFTTEEVPLTSASRLYERYNCHSFALGPILGLDPERHWIDSVQLPLPTTHFTARPTFDVPLQTLRGRDAAAAELRRHYGDAANLGLREGDVLCFESCGGVQHSGVVWRDGKRLSILGKDLRGAFRLVPIAVVAQRYGARVHAFRPEQPTDYSVYPIVHKPLWKRLLEKAFGEPC